MPHLDFKAHRLFYRQQGEGPLLVLLPGNTATSASFQGEMDHFASRFTVAALDFLGTGQSDRLSPWPLNWWRENAAQVSTLIAHLGRGPAWVVGTSGGGLSALWTAIDFPAQVRGVIADSVPARFTEALLDQILKERESPSDLLAQFYNHAQGEDWRDVIAEDNAMLRRFVEQAQGDPLGGELRRVRCPVLFTASRQDAFLSDPDETQTALARQVRHGRLYLAPRGGHPFMWTAAAEFSAVADAFLDSVQNSDGP